MPETIYGKGDSLDSTKSPSKDYPPGLYFCSEKKSRTSGCSCTAQVCPPGALLVRDPWLYFQRCSWSSGWVLFYFWESIFWLCSSGYPETSYKDQAILELTEIHLVLEWNTFMLLNAKTTKHLVQTRRDNRVGLLIVHPIGKTEQCRPGSLAAGRKENVWVHASIPPFGAGELRGQCSAT